MATAIPLSTGLSKRKFHSLKVDMTPMVDLGFLLITFFVFTATLSQPSITRLIMPAKGADMDVPGSRAITLLLGKEKAFVYEGLWEEAVANGRLTTTDYNLQSGIGHLLRDKQKRLSKKDEMVVLIKPLASSLYQNVITALDEMQINGVKKYAIVDATPEERRMH